MVSTWMLVWVIDYYLLGSNSEGWVPIDLRGFLIGPYIFATLAFAVISTVLIVLLKPVRQLFVSIIYISTLVGVIALSVFSIRIWSDIGEGSLEDDHARVLIEARRLSDAIVLQDWQPKGQNVDIVLKVKKTLASVKIKVQAVDKDGSVVFFGEKLEELFERGKRRISVPIQRFGMEQGRQWTIRLLLKNEETIAEVVYSIDPLESGGAQIERHLQPPSTDLSRNNRG